MMTREWLVTLGVCRAWVGDMLSSIRDGICVCVAVVVVALMVVMEIVVLVIVVRVSCIGVVGVLYIGLVEVDCAGVVDILVLDEVFLVEGVVVKEVVRCVVDDVRCLHLHTHTC